MNKKSTKDAERSSKMDEIISSLLYLHHNGSESIVMIDINLGKTSIHRTCVQINVIH